MHPTSLKRVSRLLTDWGAAHAPRDEVYFFARELAFSALDSDQEPKPDDLHTTLDYPQPAFAVQEPTVQIQVSQDLRANRCSITILPSAGRTPSGAPRSWSVDIRREAHRGALQDSTLRLGA